MRYALAAFMLLLSAAPALAQAPIAGVEYKVIAPGQSAPAAKVEVVEFFNYACPHCYEFEPLLKSWVSKKCLRNSATISCGSSPMFRFFSRASAFAACSMAL